MSQSNNPENTEKDKSIIDYLTEKITKDISSAEAVDFVDFFRQTYAAVEVDANRNKTQYFKMQNRIIILNAVVAIVNIIITVASPITECSLTVPVLSGIASAITVISTYYVTKRDFKKYFETWLRHRVHTLKLNSEARAYILGTEEYAKLDPKAALERFKERFNKIEVENQELFIENMSRFETGLNQHNN